MNRKQPTGNLRTKRVSARRGEVTWSVRVGWWTLALGVLTSWSWAQDAAFSVSSGESRRYAMLLGIEKYDCPELEGVYSINDVEELSQALADGGYQVWRFTEKQEAEHQPTRPKLMARIPELLAKAGPHDTFVLYLSVHGFVGPGGKLYLAPKDCSLNDLDGTGLSAEWLRDQLARCQARFKLLVLDARHAGLDRGPVPARSVAAKDLAALFENTPGLYTLASCSAKEKSWIWTPKRHSLFTYWLIQGLRGYADRDGNGEVTAGELFQFVDFHVPRVAGRVLHREQHPERVIGPRASGEAMVLRVKPRSLRGLLVDMAEQLATMAQMEGLQVLGVPEFTVDAKELELELGRDFGLLGRYCATELTGLLAVHSAGQFQVVAQDALQKNLRERKISVGAVRTRAVRGLAVEGKPVSALALGILRSRVGHRVSLQCQLLDAESLALYGTAGGEAELNEHQWAMTERSVAVEPADYRPEPTRPTVESLITHLDHKKGHPMQDPSFPYRIYLVVHGQPRRGKFQGNTLYVPLREGEVYEVHAELGDQVQQTVMLRLLVDGLSTLPEKVKYPTKGAFVEAAQPMFGSSAPPPHHPLYLPAQRVGLDEASLWALDPGRSRTFAVRGFLANAERGLYRQFQVIDAQRLSPARREFTDQLGIITAAFYEALRSPPTVATAEKPASIRARSPLGTEPGEERTEKYEPYTGIQPGKLLAVIHIRYIDAEAWDTLPVAPVDLQYRSGTVIRSGPR